MKRYLLLVVMILSSFINLNASPTQDISNLARLTGSTNEGTEFYLTFHPSWLTASHLNFVRIYVASRTQAKVNLEIPGLAYTQQLTIDTNQTGQFTLTSEQTMMYTNPGAGAIKPQPSKTWQGRAIHITSDVPIVCYAFFDGQYTGEGFMAIPVKNWGTQYKVASYADPTENTAQYLPSFTSIIAAFDNTKIEFKVGGNESMAIPLEGGTDLNAGHKITIVMNKGDIYLIPGKYAYNDLSGSYVKADKPVGVISGNYCAYVPTEVAACNYTIEMEQPYFSWGEKYYIPTIANRLKNPIIKIFPREIPTTIAQRDTTIGAIEYENGGRDVAWLERRSDNGNPRPTAYSGNKPINVVLYNSGQQDDNIESDPFQMNIIPVEQFQNDIIFEIPNYEKDKPFNNAYLSLFYLTENEGVISGDIEIGWSDSTGFKWKQLGLLTSDAGTKIATDSSGAIWMELHYKLPGYSYYSLRAKNNFGAYCYGYGNDKSFGYPAAGIYFNYDEADTLPPVCDFDNENGSSIITGKIYDVSNTPFKLAGLSYLFMDPTSSYNYSFNTDFNSINDTANFTLKIIDPKLDAYAEVVTNDKNGNDTVFKFRHFAANIYPTIDHGSIFLGYCKVSATIEKNNIFIKDTSSIKRTFTIDSIVLKKNIPGFEVVQGIAKGKSIIPLDSIPFSIKFTSDVEGEYVDSIGISANSQTIYYAEVRAIVVHGAIQCNQEIDFQELYTDSVSTPKEISIKNIGTINLLLSGIIPPSDNAFTIDGITFSQQNPLMLTPGGEKQLTVLFQPTATRNYLDSVKILSDGVGNNTIILKGKGIVNGISELNEANNLRIISTNGGISFVTNSDVIAKTIEIFDIRGVKILDLKPESYLENIHINTTNLPSGLYIVQINSGMETYIKSYIKTN